jgi:hypothetical protein
MNLETLAKKFIVSDDWLRDRLEVVTSELLRHCVTDRVGQVHVSNPNLSAKQRVMLVLVARMVASQFEPKISSTVTVKELAKSTGLPENQVRARGNDWVKRKFADSPKRGAFRAVQHKIEDFLNILPKGTDANDE